MKLAVTLRDTENLYPDLTLTYKLRDCSLTSQWIELLVENFFKADHPIEKTFSLHGWQTKFDSSKGRSVTYLCQRLNQSISIINNDLHAKGYEFIDLDFNVDNLKDETLARTMLNHIHHHFELLIGQVWAPSKWYELADDATRDAIRSLNNICHELESLLKAITNKKFCPYITIGLNGKNFQGKHFLKKNKKEITLENYRDFLPSCPWGTVTIYYSQLGKNYYEVYQDNDDFINDGNISGHRYLTGEFILNFRNNKPIDQSFRDWLISKNLDPEDPSLALNHPVVGFLEGDHDRPLLIWNLRQRNDVYKIELIDDSNNIVHSKKYEYTWKDQESSK